jgi:hypothetical protein
LRPRVDRRQQLALADHDDADYWLHPREPAMMRGNPAARAASLLVKFRL